MLLLAVAGTAGWLYRAGYRVYGVQTNSMQPAFRAGDALLVRLAAPPKVRAGDVITYRSAINPRVLVSHRVVRRQPGGFVTKGDHLAAPDPAVKDWQLVGQARAVAPGLGRWLGWLRSPLGLVTAVYVPALLVLCGEAVYLARPHRAVYRLRPISYQ